MAKIEKLGSLYFDGQPQKVGVSYNSEQLSFGDAAPGQEISWVRLQSGLLIADRCICVSISLEQLNKNGFVFGTPITIAGETYWCRCLQVGSKRDESNEWCSALDEVGADNVLWHWDNMYFWGQETDNIHFCGQEPIRVWASYRAVRGHTNDWGLIDASTRAVHVGFRPVLEHLASVPCSPDPDTLMKKRSRSTVQMA